MGSGCEAAGRGQKGPYLGNILGPVPPQVAVQVMLKKNVGETPEVAHLVEAPGGGLGDARGHLAGGDLGGDAVGCICCDGDTGDSPGVELGSKRHSWGDTGGKSVGERDGDEAGGGAGDRSRCLHPASHMWIRGEACMGEV